MPCNTQPVRSQHQHYVWCWSSGGHLIKTFATHELAEGQYSRRWGGRGNKGSLMPAGSNPVRIKSATATDKKITLVKYREG